MRYDLFDYQQDAVEMLLHQIRQRQAMFEDPYPEHSAIVLAAPTGAGKTVIATAVMEHVLGDDSDILAPSEGRTVLWVTDDKSLNQQTVQKMIVASDQWFKTTVIESGSFDQETFERGALYFMNTQAASSTARLSKNSDTQSYPIWETIANTVKKLGKDFIVVIDEAHRGTQMNRDTPTTVSKVIDGTAEYGYERVPIIIGISATAERFVKAMRLDFSGRQTKRVTSTVTVNVQDVKDSGIIKDKVVLFSPHEAGDVEADTTLMRLAVQRIGEFETRWASYSAAEGLERPVKPVLVVQVENGVDDGWLGALAGIIVQEWPGVTVRNMVNVFGEHTTRSTPVGDIGYMEPHLIESQSDVRVVFAKDAITTGWDCPRAEVLISFRTAIDATYIAQLIGRIVRQPLARRVMSDESLNGVYCVLPKFDGKQVGKVANFFNDGTDGNGAMPAVVIGTLENEFNSELFELDAETAAAAEMRNIATDVIVERTRKPGEEDVEDPTRWKPVPVVKPEVVERPVTPSKPSPAPAGKGEEGAAAGTPGGSGPAIAPKPETGVSPSPADLPGEELFEEIAPRKEPEAPAAPKRPKTVINALESIPSYMIPNRPAKGSHVARLHRLAGLLSGSTLLPDAKKTAEHQLHAFLDALAATHAEDLKKRAEAISTVVVGSKVYTTDGEEIVGDVDAGERNVKLDEHNIDGVFKEVNRLQLRDGLAYSYWRSKVSDDASDVLDAKVRVAALGSMPGVGAQVEARAEQLVDEWLDRYKLAISELKESARAEFKKLLGESRLPKAAKIVIPNSISTDLSDGADSEDALSDLRKDPKHRYPKHIFADPGATDGTFYVKLSPWEDKILRAELDRPDTVAWYRNVPRGGEKSLCIPYETTKDGKKTYAGLYPDFILLRRETTEKGGTKLRPVIIDPHGPHLPDSRDKLRGFLAYAEEHSERFRAIYPIVNDTEAKKNLALPLHSADTRREVLADLDAGKDLMEIYRKHGGEI